MAASTTTAADPKTDVRGGRLIATRVVLGLIGLAVLVVMFTFGRTRRREPGLTEDRAKYLQDAEHLGGFVLGDKALPRVTRAILEGDSETLRAVLGDQASFTTPTADSDPLPQSTGFARIERWPCQASTTGDAKGMVDWLLEQRAGFEELENVALKVKLMEPDTPGHLDGPWHGTLQLRMAGSAGGDRRREVRIRFDCGLDRIDDKLPVRDGWLSRLEVTGVEVVESERALMREMTGETGIAVERLQDNWQGISGLQTPALTGGVYLADYDGDRLLDCLLTDIRGLALYRGRPGGKFEEVTKAVGLPRDHADLTAAWADFDNDGDPDLVLGTRLFLNQGGARFTELDSATTGFELENEGVGFAVADVDNDGLIDLYIVGIGKRSVGQKWIGKNDSNRNQLWHNEGGLKFRNVTEESGTVGRGTSTLAAVFFDADNDGSPDLMTACEFGRNDFWLNNGDGTFRAVPLPEIYGGFSMGLTVGDIDNDGFGDPYLANMYSKAGERIVGNLFRGIYANQVDRKLRDFVKGSELYRNLGRGKFERIGRQAGVSDVGWAYGPAYVDLDNDGRLDLYAPVGFQSVTPDRPDG